MDCDLIDRLKTDPEEGVVLLLAQYEGMLRYIARGVLRDERDAEECLSDICLRVCERIGQYDSSRGSFSTWLTAVARNTALNMLRRRQESESLPEQLADIQTPEEMLLRQERAAELYREIKRLKEGERELLYRRFYYLQSTAQIAAELGLSERSVEGRIYRLRRKLQKRLGGEGG